MTERLLLKNNSTDLHSAKTKLNQCYTTIHLENHVFGGESVEEVWPNVPFQLV